MANNAKILIVEDEQDIHQLLKDLLNMKGYGNVSGVMTGEDALAFIQKEKPEVVFLDHVLGDKTGGMEVLVEGLKLSPETKFIMMSAHKDDYAQEARELGAYAFLDKPAQVDVILSTLSEAVK